MAHHSFHQHWASQMVMLGVALGAAAGALLHHTRASEQLRLGAHRSELDALDDLHHGLLRGLRRALAPLEELTTGPLWDVLDGMPQPRQGSAAHLGSSPRTGPGERVRELASQLAEVLPDGRLTLVRRLPGAETGAQVQQWSGTGEHEGWHPQPTAPAHAEALAWAASRPQGQAHLSAAGLDCAGDPVGRLLSVPVQTPAGATGALGITLCPADWQALLQQAGPPPAPATVFLRAEGGTAHLARIGGEPHQDEVPPGALELELALTTPPLRLARASSPATLQAQQEGLLALLAFRLGIISLLSLLALRQLRASPARASTLEELAQDIDAGLLFLDRRGRLIAEGGPGATRLLGPLPEGMGLAAALSAHDPGVGAEWAAAMDALSDDGLPRALVCAQLPDRLDAAGRELELRCRPWLGGPGLVVLVRDRSELQAGERALAVLEAGCELAAAGAEAAPVVTELDRLFTRELGDPAALAHEAERHGLHALAAWCRDWAASAGQPERRRQVRSRWLQARELLPRSQRLGREQGRAQKAPCTSA